jgi:hypothetical protein
MVGTDPQYEVWIQEKWTFLWTLTVAALLSSDKLSLILLIFTSNTSPARATYVARPGSMNMIIDCTRLSPSMVCHSKQIEVISTY